MSEQLFRHIMIFMFAVYVATLCGIVLNRDAVTVVDFHDIEAGASTTAPARTLTFVGYPNTGFMHFRNGFYVAVVHGQEVCRGRTEVVDDLPVEHRSPQEGAGK